MMISSWIYRPLLPTLCNILSGMELGPTRDVHRSLMSARHRTGATATELLNTAASLRWDAAWKSSVSGPDKERRRLGETWWDAYKPSVTVAPRSHWGGIGFQAKGDLSCWAGGSWRLSNTSARWCDESSHDCFQSFLNLNFLSVLNLYGLCVFICGMCIFMWACILWHACMWVSYVSEPASLMPDPEHQ